MKLARHASSAGLILGLMALAGPSGAVETVNFGVRDNADLVALCSVLPADPNYTAAINFCHGVVMGIVRYDDALEESPDYTPQYCFAEGLTPNQLVAAYVNYAKAHPEYGKESVGDAVLKFLTDTYPCAKTGAAPKAGK